MSDLIDGEVGETAGENGANSSRERTLKISLVSLSLGRLRLRSCSVPGCHSDDCPEGQTTYFESVNGGRPRELSLKLSLEEPYSCECLQLLLLLLILLR